MRWPRNRFDGHVIRRSFKDANAKKMPSRPGGASVITHAFCKRRGEKKEKRKRKRKKRKKTKKKCTHNVSDARKQEYRIQKRIKKKKTCRRPEDFAYYKSKETYHKAKETYHKAKETYHKAKETYYKTKETYYKSKRRPGAATRGLRLWSARRST